MTKRVSGESALRRLERIEMRVTIGELIEQPYAGHLERINGTLRDRLSCLTREIHGSATEIDTWDALFSLVSSEHNWLRPHFARASACPASAMAAATASAPRAMALHLTEHP